MKYRPYPAYKDSGVEWLRKIPARWEVLPLKRRFDVQLGKMLQNEPQSAYDELAPYIRAANITWAGIDVTDLKEMWLSPGEKKVYELRELDLLVTEGGDVGRSTLWKGEVQGCYFQNAVNRVRSRSDDLTHFLYYWMFALKHCGYIDMLCSKATISHFTAEKVREVPVVLPPVSEQHVIVAFLDQGTARIDALIAKKERLIELLQEKRTAIITHAVTKGPDSSVPMKDSGVEWLGQIPAAWGVKRNKSLFREHDRRSIAGEEELLTVSHITGVTPRSEKEVYMFEAESHEGYKLCEPDDLVVNTMWAWMGALGASGQSGMVSPSYNVYRPMHPGLSMDYFDYLCRIPPFVAELTRYSKGVWRSRLRLYPEEFLEIRSPLPPLDEQGRMVAFLDQESGKIDGLVTKVKRHIEKLREYRAAVISAAVTGKIDVREQEKG